MQAAGFSVDNLPSITQNGVRISSSLVRQALAVGDLNAAKSMLGRSYGITGVVEHGDKIGRTLDFPTANVSLGRLKPALHGILLPMSSPIKMACVWIGHRWVKVV